MNTFMTPRMRVLALLLGMAFVVFGAIGTLTPAQAVGTVHAPIVGSGSTWSANALQQWIRNVWSNYQWKLTYSESGSAQGRNDFANGTAAFGVSEIPYGIANSNEADVPPERKYAYMPIVAGGTAFMYNLQIGGKRVTNLRLSGEVISKIFTGVITTWNDPAIQADNPSLALPATPIVPVVRSDGSGTSAQVSIWMRQEHTAIWDAYCGKVNRAYVNGHCGVTSNWPVVPGSGFVARSGANGVAGYVAQPHAEGAITFVEYSYALNSGFPVAKVLNNAGYYTEPTASNVAVALLSAQINQDDKSTNYLTQDLTGVYTSGDQRTYPLSSYSYIILPLEGTNGFSANKGLTLADFGAYFLCEGQQQAETLGYSPLPINLVQAGQKQIDRIPGGNPTIQGIAACNNPTFDPNGGNRLANEAPYPSDCDRIGVAQCELGTGGAKDTPTTPTADRGTPAAPGQGQTQAGDGTGGGGTDGGTSTEQTGVDQAGTNAANQGDVQSLGAEGAGSTAATVVAAQPQSIPVDASGPLPAIAALGTGAGLLGLAAIPPIFGRLGGRRGLLPHSGRGSPKRRG